MDQVKMHGRYMPRSTAELYAAFKDAARELSEARARGEDIAALLPPALPEDAPQEQPSSWALGWVLLYALAAAASAYVVTLL